jgi:hypothetical protein
VHLAEGLKLLSVPFDGTAVIEKMRNALLKTWD